MARKLEQDKRVKAVSGSVTDLLRSADKRFNDRVMHRILRDREIAREAMRRVDRRRKIGVK